MIPWRVCVYCHKQPIDPACTPFCSERCRLLDLARWLDEDYRVAVEPQPLTSDEAVEDENEP